MLSFYTMPEYEAWREGLATTSGWDIKYYKVRRPLCPRPTSARPGPPRRPGIARRSSRGRAAPRACCAAQEAGWPAAGSRRLGSWPS